MYSEINQDLKQKSICHCKRQIFFCENDETPCHKHNAVPLVIWIHGYKASTEGFQVRFLFVCYFWDFIFLAFVMWLNKVMVRMVGLHLFILPLSLPEPRELSNFSQLNCCFSPFILLSITCFRVSALVSEATFQAAALGLMSCVSSASFAFLTKLSLVRGGSLQNCGLQSWYIFQVTGLLCSAW
jgi:hypothetical protein